MLAIDRLKKIEELLKENGSIVISNLSDLLDVSEETIRRDLEKLSKTMKFKRVRGGAYLYESSDTEVPVKIREQIYIKEKQIIGAKSVSFIDDGDTIMLDSSTTALYIAKSLNLSKKKVTVITNSIKIASELADNSLIKIINLGGTLRRRTKSYVGYMTTDSLLDLSADKAFVSCSSVNVKFGVTDNHNLEARVRKGMLTNSVKKFLVVDYTKFEEPAVNKICDIKDIDVIIIDRKLSNEHLDVLKKHKIEVVCCEE
ncbi:rhamnose catabolism operon transcriptional regulator RhaR [Vallitalea sediminicola]